MEYILWIDGQQRGPFTMGQLESMWKTGAVTADTMYWNEGLSAAQVLKDLLEPATISSGGTPPAQDHSPFSSHEAASLQARSLSPHWCWLGLTPITSGLPHLMLGQPQKGIMIIVACCSAVLLSAGSGGVLTLCTLAILDAYAVGCAKREELEIGKWDLFPNSRRCNFSFWNFRRILLVACCIAAILFLFPLLASTLRLAGAFGDVINRALTER